MSPNRLVYQVYHASRSRYDTASQDNHSNRQGNNNKWCQNIHSLLKDIDMEDTWEQNTLTEKEARHWRYTIKEKIKEREETQWKARMQEKPKLPTAKNKTTI